MPDPIATLAHAAAQARAGKLIAEEDAPVYGTSYFNAEALILLVAEAVVEIGTHLAAVSKAWDDDA